MSAGAPGDEEHGTQQPDESMQEHHHEHRHGHHHHHRHHHSSHSRRVKRRNFLLSSALIVLLVGGIAGVMIRQAWVRQQSLQVTAKNTYDMSEEGYREITVDGETWRYNNLVTTVLFAGIDSTGKMETSARYGSAARADSIELIVMDKYNSRLTIVAISRDTMTQIRRYSSIGNDDGLYTSHLGYAYTWGNGGTASCESLTEAVSLLFDGIPILDYVVMNQDSMVYVNDLVGGITVTVPNSELAEEYPELTEGAVVTLDESNVRAFLQYRDTSEDFSNEGRMERQQAYITAYIETVRQMSSSEIESAWESLTEMEDYLQTSITKNQYLELAELVQSLDFSESDYIQLSGEDEAGELHDEFYVDEEALQELILELFYIKD